MQHHATSSNPPRSIPAKGPQVPSSSPLQGIMQNNNESLDEMWEFVESVVKKILTVQDVNKDEWHSLFYKVHKGTLWNPDWADSIRQKLSTMIMEHISLAKERVMRNQEESALLTSYITEWKRFFSVCDYLPHPFISLSTQLDGKQHLSGPNKAAMQCDLVRKLMLDSWNKIIFQEIKSRLQSSAMKLVYDERNGEVIDSSLVIGVRQSYVSLSTSSEDKLQIYQENFEKAYLESTEKFYRQRSAEYLEKHGVREYMNYASRNLREEDERAKRFLESSYNCDSVKKLNLRCVDVFVNAFQEQILSECPAMIRANDTEKLAQMFTLLDRADIGVSHMEKYLEQYILQDGLEDMRMQADTITIDCEKYVDRLLALFHKYTALVKEAFQDDPRFLTARDKAYRDLVNDTSVFSIDLTQGRGYRTPESRCPELLANYCDLMLRKNVTTRRLTTEQIEARLRDVLLVLKYVQNRDVFIRYHKTHLTRRLILELSADNEMEENMVEWLRDVGMPAENIGKLGRMFQDMKISQDLNAEFKESVRLRQGEELADIVNIKVLNSGAWLKQADSIPLTFPRDLEDYIPEVEKFYRNKHQGRRLQWNHLFSHGVLQFTSLRGVYDLEVTTHQMVILFTWNGRPDHKQSFDSLVLATGLPEAELKRTLWTLVRSPKTCRPVIMYSPEVQNFKDLTNTTDFWLNSDFSVIKGNKAQSRGKVSLVGRLQLQSDKVPEEENRAIMELRRLRVQEGIVRIMKMRKRLHHANLYTELVELLRNLFVPSKKLIKETLEWLIEERLIRRDDKDMNFFVYIM